VRTTWSFLLAPVVIACNTTRTSPPTKDSDVSLDHVLERDERRSTRDDDNIDCASLLSIADVALHCGTDEAELEIAKVSPTPHTTCTRSIVWRPDKTLVVRLAVDTSPESGQAARARFDPRAIRDGRILEVRDVGWAFASSVEVVTGSTFFELVTEDNSPCDTRGLSALAIAIADRL
jgi:hypothetical protein